MRNFSDIPIFLTVVEEKSFTKAAEKLGLTNSAVSKRVSTLEKHLKVKLLNRTTRKLDLTEAGERYFEYAKQASLAVEEAEYSATENVNEPHGILRISSALTFGNTVLAKHLPIFLKKYPHLKVEADLTDVFTKVRMEEFDVILTTAQFHNSSYRASNIYTVEIITIASPEFISLYGSPDNPEELLNFNCLLPSAHKTPNEWLYFKDKDEIKVKVSGNAQINSPESVRLLTLSGVGISCLPKHMVDEDIKKGNLVPILDDFKITPAIFQAIYPKKNYLPSKVKVFIDFLKYEIENSQPFSNK
jgi:DNA-binding transcriptional LysR family regulator